MLNRTIRDTDLLFLHIDPIPKRDNVVPIKPNIDNVIPIRPLSSGSLSYPFTARVEALLGGVGRLERDDGRLQFARVKTFSTIVFSPCLHPRELEAFCRKNLSLYERHHEAHLYEIFHDLEMPPMDLFWRSNLN